MPPTIEYRACRNSDPPQLVALWNAAAAGGRGAYPLKHGNDLEGWLFARPYFDPAGLVTACTGTELIGFAHAGFGPEADQSRLSTRVGVVCAVLVHPAHRRRGIGTELLRRCEEHLAGRGAEEIRAGPQVPYNPFYTGLYGGSSAPGFLISDTDAAPFLHARGYAEIGTCPVLQKRIGSSPFIADARFMGLRRRFEFQVVPQTALGSWWRECTLGPLDPHDFRLIDRLNGLPAARLLAWEMEGFGQRWGAPSVGILEVQVRPDLRRQGLAKFLLAQALRLFQEQFFETVEVQMPAGDAATLALFRALGFDQVDEGRAYRRGAS